MPHRLRKSGFTLIEILIVMLIISIVAGVASVSINRNQRKQFETTAQQLTHLIILAEQEAMLRPTTIGLALTQTSYQFYSYAHDAKTNQDYWQALTSNAFKPRLFPKDTEIKLTIGTQSIPTDGKPVIIINSSSDITPFTIFIGKKAEDPYYQIDGKANGEVTSEVFQAQQ